MKHTRLRSGACWSRGLFAALFALLVALAFFAARAHSQGAGTPVVGWAWSDTVGWIELHCSATTPNCTTWGLMNSGSTIGGYAWSDVIGWLRPAQSGDGCPGTGATVSGNAVSGWLRALAAGGGWDGCISLSGASPAYGVLTTPNSSYAPATSGAWGSDYIGWLGFNVTSASCTDTNWSCNGTVASRFDSLSCTTIANNCAPYTCVGSGTMVQDPCSDPRGINGCVLSVGTYTPCASKKSIVRNTATTLWWNVTNVTDCSITKNGSAWQSGLGASNPAGGLSTGPISSATNFAISCTSSVSGPPFTGSATVNILPVYKEL